MHDYNLISDRDPLTFKLLSKLCHYTVFPYHRVEIRGLEKIPEGPALFIGNHNAAIWSADTFILAQEIFKACGLHEVPYFLVHEFFLKIPCLYEIFSPLGALCASHENAHRLFQKGYKAIVYPGGDIEGLRPFRERNKIIFADHHGYVHLALQEKIPVIPVVAAGSHATFIIIDNLKWLAELLGLDKIFRLHELPLTFSFPFGFSLGLHPFYIPFPVKIIIEVMEPVYFDYEKVDTDELEISYSRSIEQKMQVTLNKLAQEIKNNFPGF